MIESCGQCRKSCCKTGPGPHTAVTPNQYLKNFGDVASYNTKCRELVGGKCGLWGTPKLSSNCRAYICQSRQYSKKELNAIRKVTSDRCGNCGAKYVLYDGKKWRCELCGHTET